jgi:hypothetical protein
VDLSTYKWKNRLLLIFAAPGEEYEEQLRLLGGLSISNLKVNLNSTQ